MSTQQQSVSFKEVVQFFAARIRPHKTAFVLFFLITGIAVVSWTASTFVIAAMIDELTIDTAIDSGVIFLFVVFITLRAMNQIGYRIGDFIMHKTQPLVVEEVRSYAYQDVMKRSYTYFANASSGRVAHWANSISDTFDIALSLTFWNMWGRSLNMVAAVVFLALTDWTIAIIFCVWLIALFVYTSVRGKTFTKLVETQSDEKSKSVQLIVDGLANNSYVRVLSAHEREIAYVNRQRKHTVESRQKAWFYNVVTNFSKDTSSVVATAIATIVALVLLANGNITIGGFVLLYTYFSQASGDLWTISWGIDQYFSHYGTVQNALSNLRGSDERTTPQEKLSRNTKNNVSLQLEDLSFAYPEKPETKVIDEVSLSVSAGQKLGVVGHSGAGKTTLVNILLALQEPTSGRLLVNEEDYMRHDPSWVRQMSSFVPQDTTMFNRTVRENIMYARPDATDDELLEALKQSQAYDFVMELPNGLDTIVGERGVKLSGGQRQRIAIARAILRDAPILILDEATSALDSVSEQAIQKALHKLMRGRTAVVIAHRLSTLKHLDNIVVLEKGKIAEQGTHDELLKKKGIYADLWKRQKDGFIVE